MKRKVGVIASVAVIAGMMLASCSSPSSSGTSSAATATPAATNAPAATATAAATSAATAAATAAATSTAQAATPSKFPPSGTDPYTFMWYYNYQGQTIHPWGQDEVSQLLAKKFNITMNQSAPDSDPTTKMNLMISSGTLPDVLFMDRGPQLTQLAKLGMLVPLTDLMAENPTAADNYNQNISKFTQGLLSIDGVLYTDPTWGRNSDLRLATGGNMSWLYAKKIYDAAGDPALKTFDDLYNYAMKIKTSITTTTGGLPTIPAFFSQDATGNLMASGFYRSNGGPNMMYSWFVPYNNKLTFVFRDPKFKTAVETANKWFTAGLISPTCFTNTSDQDVEQLSSGRVGLGYYDFSQDSNNHFRGTLMAKDPGNTYIVNTDPIYPPMDGVSKIYGENAGSEGWNATVITKYAKNPQRCFDLISYMGTKEFAGIMQYGPPSADGLYTQLDSNGFPILTKSPNDVALANKLGLWFWSMQASSDWVDKTKFAVNAQLPADQQDWVVTNQANIWTPQKIFTDEDSNLSTTIDPTSDLGIKLHTIQQQINTQLPQIIMASSQAQCDQMYQQLITFCDQNGMPDIENALNPVWQQNAQGQGGSVYTNP